jgi:hypothetical protein
VEKNRRKNNSTNIARKIMVGGFLEQHLAKKQTRSKEGHEKSD